MKKSLIALAALAVVGMAFDKRRARTHDVAFTYRMGAGFAGDVNRTHPASIVAGLQDSTTPVRKYGEAAIIDTATNAYRGIEVGDASDTAFVYIDGVLVRDYPVQAATSAGSFGQQTLSDSTTPPQTGVINVVEDGHVMVKVRGTGTITKDGKVFIFCAVDEAGHVQGGFEVAEIAGKTVEVGNARFNGPADSNGITELRLWKQAAPAA